MLCSISSCLLVGGIVCLHIVHVYLRDEERKQEEFSLMFQRFWPTELLQHFHNENVVWSLLIGGEIGYAFCDDGAFQNKHLCCAAPMCRTYIRAIYIL